MWSLHSHNFASLRRQIFEKFSGPYDQILGPLVTSPVWHRQQIIRIYYRPRTEYDGMLCFHRCLSVNRGGGGTPRYLRPQPKYQPSGQDWWGKGRGTPRYQPPWPRYLPPSQVWWGRGYPKVPTPPPQPGLMGEGVPQCTYPTPTPRQDSVRVLDTPRSVCLLRSRRRAFFYTVC